MDRGLTGQLLEHRELVESLADRMSRRHRDEYDDLIQEGMIAVWEAVKLDRDVKEDDIEKRMRKWLRYRGRQKRDTPTSYDKLLPMTDLRAVHAAILATRQLEGHGPDAAG